MIVFLFLFLATVSKGKVDFRQTAANKAFIDSLRDGQYEVVHPFQIREKNDRIGIDTRNYFLRGKEHYEDITVVIRSNTIGRLKIVASRNDHLLLNQTVFRKLDTAGEHTVHDVERCHYQGSIAGDKDSIAVFSSCAGIRGIISFSNGSSFGIFPLEGGDRGKRHPHVLYKANWTRMARCGTVDSMRAEAPTRHRRDTRHTKHIEMAIVADHHMMSSWVGDEEGAIRHVLDIANTADLILSHQLHLRLSIVYVELWSDVQRVDMLSDGQRTLAGFVDYTTGHMHHIQKDVSLLLTGTSFANDELSVSAFRGVCTAQSASIVSSIGQSGAWSGQLAAHSIAHVIGLEHDSPACGCDGRCVMEAVAGSPDSPFLWHFSKCSVAKMRAVWQSGHVQCLLNRPFQESSLGLCGNGVVDDNEECDCGPRESCSDACCDALTCTLRPHAQCAAHHVCCSRCAIIRAGHVCRPSTGICDVAETCDGRHADCPPDAHLMDGTTCGEAGQCWRGNCSDSTLRCRSLWGKDARVADDACFEQNSQGHEYANCGRDGGGIRPCGADDIGCGTLHCTGGAGSPKGTARSFVFQFVENNQNVQCKAVVDGLVADGTHCASGRVCVEGSCVDATAVSSPVSCPTNNVALPCSGHGDCTTHSECVCRPGWKGIACDQRAPKEQIVVPSLVPGQHIDTSVLLVILVCVGTVLFLLLLCLLFCYRRRSTLEVSIASDEKGSDILPPRSIKFGNMPSYREEKRKKKSNKLIYGALNRITEAEERDSTSLRSREMLHEIDMLPDRHVYAETVIGIGGEERPAFDVHFSPYRFSSHRFTPSQPFQLNNIEELLKKFEGDEDEVREGGSNTESSRDKDSPSRPPFRSSPSLFNDSFQLDISTPDPN